MLMFNIGFFALIALQSGGLDINPYNLWRAGANDHALVVTVGEPWRLITYAFLHAGVLHILFNCYVLAVVGPLVENRFGSPRNGDHLRGRRHRGRRRKCVPHRRLLDRSQRCGDRHHGCRDRRHACRGHRDGAPDPQPAHLLDRPDHLDRPWRCRRVGEAESTISPILAGLPPEPVSGRSSSATRSPPAETFQLEAVIGTLLVVGSIGAMVGHQIWVKDIPTLDRRSQAALEAVERQMRSACFDALDGPRPRRRDRTVPGIPVPGLHAVIGPARAEHPRGARQ